MNYEQLEFDFVKEVTAEKYEQMELFPLTQ